MASSKAATVQEYVEELPEDRRAVIAAVRKVIVKNLPKGFQETMNWGMISYEVSLERCPETYNGQPLSYAALAAQKNYYGLYLMPVYGNKKLEIFLRDAFKKAGKKLDMGKACVRFRKLEDLPLDAIGELIGKTSVDQWIKCYEESRRR